MATGLLVILVGLALLLRTIKGGLVGRLLGDDKSTNVDSSPASPGGTGGFKPAGTPDPAPAPEGVLV